MSSPIRIVIAALGGEGGGVLGNWIADMAAREGYLSQTTSVPGVAQRTGATIYYIELFPRQEAERAGQQPVMSMFPTPGDVDIVICSEIVEAGRMIQRGFVTPDRTTLVTSTHRTYGITEKQAMGDGTADSDAIAEVAALRARRFVAFDMLETARRHDSVINAALFGALAGTGVLPFSRDSFEETIRLGKIAVDSNLATFSDSYQCAGQRNDNAVQVVDPSPAPEPFKLPAGTSARGKDLVSRISCFPAQLQEVLYLGVKRLVDYQDYDYADQYLDRVRALLDHEQEGRDYHFTREAARFLALWMAFEDLPRVAQNKISAGRFQRFREEVRAQPGQRVDMVEFLHPRVEELCGAMPAGIGRRVHDSPFWSRLVGLFAGPRNVRTNSVSGFVTFYLMAAMRRIRRASLIYQIENDRIEDWLAALHDAAQTDYELALELALCGRLVKGYGSTRERGNRSLRTVIDSVRQGRANTASAVARLRDAALADDRGETLQQLTDSIASAS